jgi:threonine synthase
VNHPLPALRPARLELAPEADDRSWRSYLSHLECSLTGERFSVGQPHGLSPAGKPLLARYALERARSEVDRDELARRPQDMWRYRELLPVCDPAHLVSLGEQTTPLVALSESPGRLLVKDESRLPTGSFKARGQATAMSMARRFGFERVAMPTNGNAGSAMAAYSARAGIEAWCFCPVETPDVHVGEMLAAGAHVFRVDGMIDDCGAIVRAGREPMGWFPLSTMQEPYRVEGKKTMGFELAEQFGWELPEVIIYATGGGTALIAMWKAFDELEALGWISSARPRMVAAQSTGCAPIVRAFEQGQRHAQRWQDARTIAAGIRVPSAIADFMILDVLTESGGWAEAVSDELIEAAQSKVARSNGLLMCPEGAATYAVYEAARARGDIAADERVVLFNCATGIKYPMPSKVPVIRAGDPVDWDAPDGDFIGG